MLQVLQLLKLLFGCEDKPLSVQTVRWFASLSASQEVREEVHKINQLEYG
ncbi:hypothetical protein [Burkholderia phage vB_BpP_HN05]